MGIIDSVNLMSHGMKLHRDLCFNLQEWCGIREQQEVLPRNKVWYGAPISGPIDRKRNTDC